MCGIAGILKFTGEHVRIDELKKITDIIQHRGPDNEGFWINSKMNVGFGHRRLSIIDLSDNGKQPMHYSNGRYTITYNGEIYNYIELKKTLQNKGYLFQSDCDTEVLLALYDFKKEGCLDDLDGMFAFAIWDENTRELFCARDRFGEKPFHYYYDERQFVFGSEIKQFWELGIQKKISENRINSYLESGLIDDENDITSTFYENIKRLDAAHYLIIKENKITIKKYWSIDLRIKYKGSLESASEKLRDLLSESISLRLRSDVPVGSSLSGGIDSSSIVMLIDKLKGSEQKQTSFSARFKNFDKDEGKYIESVIAACRNIQPYYTWPDEKYFLENFDKINFYQDEPYGSSSIVAQYAVMELAAKNNVTVLLDGQGADEYFAGYPPYYNVYINQLFFNNKAAYKNEIQLAAHNANTQVEEIRESLRMKAGRLRRAILSQEMPYSNDALQNKLLSDTTSAGLKILLRYADRNAMAHSREVRLPFLSHKLVEFVFSLPDSYKLNGGWTKYVLRKSMDNLLPKDICWRKDKIGYAAPQNTWLHSPEMKEEIGKAARNFNVSSALKLSYEKNPEYGWRLLQVSRFA
jgi:asparagine synthase (glutamine-hydrolysing)